MEKDYSYWNFKTDTKMEAIYKKNPGYFTSWQQGIKAFNSGEVKSSSTVVTIPVHMIITHPPGQSVGSGVNFSLAHIESQIQVLNEDFRKVCMRICKSFTLSLKKTQFLT